MFTGGHRKMSYHTHINDGGQRLVNGRDGVWLYSLRIPTIQASILPTSWRQGPRVYSVDGTARFTTRAFQICVKQTHNTSVNSTADCLQKATGNPHNMAIWLAHWQRDWPSVEDMVQSIRPWFGHSMIWLKWQPDSGSRTYSTVVCLKKVVSTAVVCLA